MPVVNVETGETVEIGKLESVYSNEWAQATMGAASSD
jgi:hypothetical protein